MITLHRQAGDTTRPATPDSPTGALVARWQAGFQARRWLDDLVASGSAIDLGGGGYPSWMTARASAVLPVVRDGPPHARGTSVMGGQDVVDLRQGPGKTVYDHEVAEACHDDEWLLIEIWDES